MDGFDDILDIFKFWKLFKNILNFRRLGVMRQVGMVATVLIFIAGIGLTFVNVDRLLLGGLDLTSQDEPVMEACLKNYEISEMEFTEVSNAVGCACTSKIATSVYAEKELNTYLNAHAILINKYSRRWTARTDEQKSQINADAEGAYGRLRKSSGMETAAYTELVERMEDADETCDQYESYEGDSLTKLAALRPINYAEAQFAKGLSDTAEGSVELSLRGTSKPTKLASQ